MNGPTVAAWGAFGHGNLGNEATLAAFLGNLRERVPEVRVLCVAPEGAVMRAGTVEEVVAVDPLPLRALARRQRWLRSARKIGQLHLASEPARRWLAARHLRQVAALAIVGTGVIDDYAQGPLDLPNDLQRWCRAARSAKVPTSFLSVGAEPISDPTMIRYFREAAEGAAYRSFRDEASRRNAAAIGIPTERDPVMPDLVFSLLPGDLPVTRPPNWPPREVGVGLMGYYGWNLKGDDREAAYQRYLGSVQRFVEWLLAGGYRVRLILGDVRDDQRPLRDLIERVAQGPSLGARARLVCEPIADFRDLLHQVAETDLVVGTRFHNVLFALLLGRPALSISYSAKSDALLAEYGLAHPSQRPEAMDVRQLIEAFVLLRDRTPHFLTELVSRNQAQRARLGDQYGRFVEQLRGGRRA